MHEVAVVGSHIGRKSCLPMAPMKKTKKINKANILTDIHTHIHMYVTDM